MNNYAYLGIVQQGRFKLLATEHDTVDLLQLTNLPITTQELPESAEISLAPYEGSIIIVRGFDQGNWIYSAVVIEQAGLILTAVAQEVFTRMDQSRQYRLKFPWV